MWDDCFFPKRGPSRESLERSSCGIDGGPLDLDGMDTVGRIWRYSGPPSGVLGKVYQGSRLIHRFPVSGGSSERRNVKGRVALRGKGEVR